MRRIPHHEGMEVEKRSGWGKYKQYSHSIKERGGAKMDGPNRTMQQETVLQVKRYLLAEVRMRLRLKPKFSPTQNWLDVVWGTPSHFLSSSNLDVFKTPLCLQPATMLDVMRGDASVNGGTFVRFG